MKRSKIETLIDEAPEIPTLPVVATRVLGVVRDRSSTAGELRHLIELDPVLSAKTMRLANSAYFGLPDEVTDLHRAIVLLGFNAVRNLAFAACLKSLYTHEY
ncbi:MAG: HDOD domain-containing protein, partial [bacterium]|nr:HDOD domain-containing protein [bacterium]